METLIQDLRFAARTLAKSRGFVVIAVLCLGLGIGVNTTIFSTVNAILLRPFPFHDPDRIVVLEEQNARAGINQASISFQSFRDYRDQSTQFSSMAAQSWRSLTLTEGDEPERLNGATVSWNLFQLLGISPAAGRHFREDEDRAGAPGAVMLSWNVWQRRYNADPAVVGQTIMVNSVPHTVVGVMPEKFAFPENHEIWVPITTYEDRSSRRSRGIRVYARMRDGVSLAQARAEVQAISDRMAREYAESEGWRANLRTIQDRFTPDEVRLIVLTMMGAVTFVLLIACANVANLLLARATSRHREIAIRSALGAGRRRIVRQLLTESVLLALAGGALGLLVARWGLDLLTAAIPAEDPIPYMFKWELDRATLVYTIAISVLTGIIFGLAPALQATKQDLQTSLKDGGRGLGSGSRRNRLRNGLVIAEVALSLVLLVGASLFVKSFLNIQRTDVGFDVTPLMTLRYYLPGDNYLNSISARTQRARDLIERIEALPGVRGATASNTILLGGGGSGGRWLLEGRSFEPGEEPQSFWTGVTPGWFRTYELPILRGRDFTPAEGWDSTRVAIITETFATRFWPGEDPIGRRIRMADDTTGEWFTVIGVTRELLLGGADDDDGPDPAVFLPFPFLAPLNTGVTIRVAGSDPTVVMPAVRQAIRASDPQLPVFQVLTMDATRRLDFWDQRLFGQMFTIFGLIALFLASIGVYGVISYGVSQRTQEIGVRMALGARGRDVLRLVVGQGVRLASIGILIGIAGAFGITKVIESILFNVNPWDPVSFSAVALFMLGVAALASWVPARRAMAVDPMQALRYE